MLLVIKIFLITLLSLFSFELYAKDKLTIDEKVLKISEKSYGKEAVQRVKNLIKFLNSINNKSEEEKLKLVNDYFNNIKFDSDIDNWKVPDYWATRLEFLGKNKGDCEDYVIAKYFSLIQLGISEVKLYLTYVKAIKYRQSHMVLTYFKNKNEPPLVLDNINKKILPSTKRDDLWPLFSFNGEKIYMAKQRGLGRIIPNGKVNLKQWTNLILKIKREKI